MKADPKVVEAWHQQRTAARVSGGVDEIKV